LAGTGGFGSHLGSPYQQKSFRKKLVHAHDVIIHGRSTAEHDARLAVFLRRCKELGIKLNKKKMEVAIDSITCMGHEITAEGLKGLVTAHIARMYRFYLVCVSVRLSKIEALVKFRAPKDLTELRRFVGMANYLAKFVRNLATILQQLHDLMIKDTSFIWSNSQGV